MPQRPSRGSAARDRQSAAARLPPPAQRAPGGQPAAAYRAPCVSCRFRAVIRPVRLVPNSRASISTCSYGNTPVSCGSFTVPSKPHVFRGRTSGGSISPSGAGSLPVLDASAGGWPKLCSAHYCPAARESVKYTSLMALRLWFARLRIAIHIHDVSGSVRPLDC